MNSAPAAAPRNNAATAKGNLAKMDAALQLSDAQKAAILPILQKLQDELSTLRDSGAGRGADAGQTFTNTAINQVRAELTAVQAQSFDNMREPRRAELFRF